MGLIETSGNAEAIVADAIEAIRKEVILRIAGASKITGYEGSSLRSVVDQFIDRFPQAKYKVASSLREAWESGVHSAEADNSENAEDSGSSTQVPDVQPFQEMLSRSFDSLKDDIKDRVARALHRPSLNDTITKDDVLKEIGVNEGEGIFAEFRARAIGIVNREIETVEGRAYQLRAAEITKAINQHLKSGTGSKNLKSKVASGQKPHTIDTWIHSGGGNPPRINHEAMDGKGVPEGMQFLLQGNDGNSYWCDGPHSSQLPRSETKYCHCRKGVVVIWCTDQQFQAMQARAKSTGGYRDGRWS